MPIEREIVSVVVNGSLYYGLESVTLKLVAQPEAILTHLAYKLRAYVF